MITVEFAFNVDDVVIVTMSGKKGTVNMIGKDDGGKKYFVQLADCGQWYKENQITKAE